MGAKIKEKKKNQKKKMLMQVNSENLKPEKEKSSLKGIDPELIIKKLEKEKDELEGEFTEILGFILNDMKQQESFIANILNEDESNNDIVNYYKRKLEEAEKVINSLENKIGKLEKRIKSLENSTLGKITLRYWKLKKRL